MTLAEGLSLEELVHRSNAYRALLARIEGEANRLSEAALLLHRLGRADGAEVAEDHARRLRELVKEEP